LVIRKKGALDSRVKRPYPATCCFYWFLRNPIFPKNRISFRFALGVIKKSWQCNNSVAREIRFFQKIGFLSALQESSRNLGNATIQLHGTTTRHKSILAGLTFFLQKPIIRPRFR
jgi:hypothetical protein